MRVFVFFLMMVVAIGGLLGGYRVITGKDLVSLSDFGVGRAAAKAVLTPTPSPQAAAPTSAPTLAPLPVKAPAPTATPAPAKPRLMAVANTDGVGVYLRRTPHLNDKVRPWMDGTKVEVSGDAIESDGVQWMKVRTPDGVEGYIPQQFLVPAP